MNEKHYPEGKTPSPRPPKHDPGDRKTGGIMGPVTGHVMDLAGLREAADGSIPLSC